MTDRLTTEQRSRVMASVRNKDTDIELFVRSALHRKGLRFRKNVAGLPGRPDIVLPKYHTIVFVHGCFWHQHLNCRAATLPTTRREFWETKISKNVARDKENIEKLLTAGWNVLIVWECSIKYKSNTDRETAINQLVQNIKEPLTEKQRT